MTTQAQFLEDQFLNYMALVFPDAPAEQVIEFRRTWYAAIHIALNTINAVSDINERNDAAFAELEKYYEMAQKDIAALDGRKPS